MNLDFELYVTVEQILNKWKYTEERMEAIEKLKMLENKKIYLFVMPSALTLALLTLSSTRENKIVIREYKKIFGKAPAVNTVRHHRKRIGDLLGK